MLGGEHARRCLDEGGADAHRGFDGRLSGPHLHYGRDEAAGARREDLHPRGAGDDAQEAVEAYRG